MDFKIDKTTLAAALKGAAGVADTKSTMPVLANALVRVVDGKLLVAATDLNLSTITTLPLAGATPGGVTVAAKKLHEIVAGLPGAEVTLKVVDKSWVVVKAGKVDYRVVGLPDRDFPKLPDDRDAAYVTVDAGALRGMLAATVHSICNDETRFHLNGVLVESDGKTLRMVSTDGHRLAKADRKLKGPKLAAGVIVPKKGVLELRKLLDGAKEVELAIRSPFLFVKRAESMLAVKLIDAQFPPYGQVIPKDHATRSVVSREALLGALRRCQLMASKTRGVKFEFAEAVVKISADRPDVGEVREEVECQTTGPGIIIGVNGKYLIDLANVLEDVDEGAIAIGLGGALDPLLVRSVADPDAFVGVVMPMRI